MHITSMNASIQLKKKKNVSRGHVNTPENCDGVGEDRFTPIVLGDP
jgi:hypothetical protein